MSLPAMLAANYAEAIGMLVKTFGRIIVESRHCQYNHRCYKEYKTLNSTETMISRNGPARWFHDEAAGQNDFHEDGGSAITSGCRAVGEPPGSNNLACRQCR